MRMAGRVSRRVRGWAQAHQIPVMDCSAGDRKHEIAEEQLEKANGTQGLFLILVSRAQAPVWDRRPGHHLERFQQALSCMDQCFIADQTLEQLPASTWVGQTRVGSIDFNKPRML